MTHFEFVASVCAESVLSASLRLPLSSLVLADESDDPLWYFLVSILDKACKAILVRDDLIGGKNIKMSVCHFNSYNIGWHKRECIQIS